MLGRNRKVQFEQNNQQGMKFSGKNQNSSKNEDSQRQSMADFIRKCVAETGVSDWAGRRLQTSISHTKKPDAKQPSA